MTTFHRRHDDPLAFNDVMRLVEAAHEANTPVILFPRHQRLLIKFFRESNDSLARAFALQIANAGSDHIALVGGTDLDPAGASTFRSTCSCGEVLLNAVERRYGQCEGCYAAIRWQS